MKKVIISSLLLLFAAASFSQETDPKLPLTREDHLEKSKSQKTAAWILAGGGTAMVIAGTIIALNNYSIFSDSPVSAVVLFSGGIGAVAVSIPLFISSSRNKNKAMSITASLKMEEGLAFDGYTMIHASHPALSVRINKH